MKHQHSSRRTSKVFSGMMLALAFLLVACGGESEEADPTATADTAQEAAPTVPSNNEAANTPVSEDEITIVDTDLPEESEATATADTEDEEDSDGEGTDLVADSVASPASDAESTPAVDESDDDSTATTAVGTPIAEVVVATPAVAEEADDIATPAATGADEESVAATPRASTGNETHSHPGDGTGGSGMVAPDDLEEDETDATPQASPSASPEAVAQLNISGCEVPDVPGFLGDDPSFTLTAELNFRSGPGTECDPLIDEPLAEGQVVEVIGGPVTQTDDDSEWVQISVDGVEGWVTTEFLEPAE